MCGYWLSQYWNFRFILIRASRIAIDFQQNIAVPYLFHCKPRLIKFFFSSFRAAYNQGRLIFFVFFALSKGIDDAQPLLGYVFFGQTLFSHSTILFSITCTLRRRRDYDEQKAAVVVYASLTRLRINAKRASTRKYFREA